MIRRPPRSTRTEFYSPTIFENSQISLRKKEKERQCPNYKIEQLISSVESSFCIQSGDKDFKQNKLLPPEKQIIAANPDIKIVSI